MNVDERRSCLYAFWCPVLGLEFRLQGSQQQCMEGSKCVHCWPCTQVFSILTDPDNFRIFKAIKASAAAGCDSG